MAHKHDLGAMLAGRRARRWAVGLAISLLALEIVYVVAANGLIRSGVLQNLINKKPEKTSISWTSAASYFPGFVSVEGFTLTSQTRKNQVYLTVAEASGRLSLVELIFRTVHFRGVTARDADFRYRPRLDRPAADGETDASAPPPAGAEYFPEIPGLSNPPDPRPEDLYPLKKKKHPWTIAITGAEVEGPIEVSLGQLALVGDGRVRGGVVVKPRDTVTIHRGGVELARTTVSMGAEKLTDDLAIDADLRFEPFPARGAKPPDVLGGISGSLVLKGSVGEAAAVGIEITPGIDVSGAGTIDADLELDHGVLLDGSSYHLTSGNYNLNIMGLNASGTAEVSTTTARKGREHLTSTQVVFGDFEFVNPEDGSVNIAGSGLELDAEWIGFSIAGSKQASRVEVVIPSTEVRDVRAFNRLLPPQSPIELRSGTGTVESRLLVDADRVAVGTIDLSADDIVLSSDDVPIQADLEVHTNLARGDLPARTFDLSGTTIRLDDLVSSGAGSKADTQDTWFCDIELESGRATLGAPIRSEGSVKLEMSDTRPVAGMLKSLGVGPSWLARLPNIKNVDGTLNLRTGADGLGFSDVNLAADGFEVLGWLVLPKTGAEGRIYARFKALDAGISLDAGKAKIILAKPRKWFAEQTTGPGS